jgi:hypothetical protein
MNQAEVGAGQGEGEGGDISYYVIGKLSSHPAGRGPLLVVPPLFGNLSVPEAEEVIFVVTTDGRQPQFSDPLYHGTPFRAAANQITTHQDLVDPLVRDVVENRLKGWEVAVNIGEDGEAVADHCSILSPACKTHGRFSDFP